jgi:hypothetical protein
MFRNLEPFEIAKVDSLSVGSHVLELPPLSNIVLGSSHTWYLRSSENGPEIMIGPQYKYEIKLGALNSYPKLYIRTIDDDQWITAVGGYAT